VHLTLRTLREATGKTQVDVAQDSKMDQADISRLEGRIEFGDCQVATLQRYVAALGGQLELVAMFGDKRISIVGIEATSVANVPANKALQRTGRKPSRR
jgi:transcriptional regulator with XRE-family HTH domain